MNSTGGNGNELITDCNTPTIYGVQDDSNFNPNYTLTTTNVCFMDYGIDVTGKQTLYFDCFDKLSNSLSEDINGSFMVTVMNGQVKQIDYPSQSSSGLLSLGNLKNEHVNVRVNLKKNITSCRSYGVFGLHHNVLEKALEQRHRPPVLQTVTANFPEALMQRQDRKYCAECHIRRILKIKVNGKAVSYDKVFGDLVSFDLQEGENTITVTSVPNGFYAGLALTIAGIALTVGYFFIERN